MNRKNDPRSTGKRDIELGRRIRLRRVEIGLSQSYIADKLGVTFQQVQKYERGVNRVGAARLQKIAYILEVPVSFFYGMDAKAVEVESLLFVDSSFAIRLLRAYSNIRSADVRRRIVAMMETLAKT